MNDNEAPLRDVVADQLRALILSGELPPGERLLEAQLAKRLGVSRNPVREAIRSLEAMGLIEVVPHKGAHVATFDRSEVHHTQQIRILVEGYLAEQAALRQDSEAIEQIRLCLEERRSATERGDDHAADLCHRRFHETVLDAAGLPSISQVLDLLRSQTVMVFSMVTERRGEVTWEEHQAIYNAVAAGDAKQAGDLVREHLAEALEFFENAIDSLAAEPASLDSTESNTPDRPAAAD